MSISKESRNSCTKLKREKAILIDALVIIKLYIYDA